MEKRYDVFISYSTQDQKVVEGIRDFLEREGYRCFVAYRDIPRGVVWATAITDAIDASAMMLVVFSNAFNGSPQTDREIELASENRIPILTFRVANAPMTGAKKYYLKNLNWIDAFPNPENYFGNLLDSVVRLIGPSSIVMDRAAEEEAERLAREEAERKAREEAERERLAAQGIFPGAFPHGGNPVFTGVSEGRRNFEPDEPSTPPPPVVPTDKPTPINKKPLWIALGAVAALALLLVLLWPKPKPDPEPVFADLDTVALVADTVRQVQEPLEQTQTQTQTQTTTETTPPTNTSSSSLTITANGVSFVMKRVAGGTFQMGSNDSEAYDDEKPVHSVTVSTFYMGETEVTQALWKAVMGSNPSNWQGDNLPVERVSWNDCQEFIRKLNQMTGKNFRLPTEAEWEFAARGGNKSNGYKYAGSNNIGSVAWYDGNSGNKTHAVKGKSPNELGLYDMSGNVWDWCGDWYGSYGSGSQTNPKGASSGSGRVLRGGSWANRARPCRVSDRLNGDPSSRIDLNGFRLCFPQ